MTEDKKIIIDEDWKSQVEAEKRVAEKEAAAKQPAPSPAAAGATRPGATGPGGYAMPPASLEMLVTTLATESLMALGQIPHPQSGQPIFEPVQAKYLIDTIEVLREKTKGNTTPQEAQLMEEILHQLRLAYVQLAGIEPAKPQSTSN
jgi:3-oxoacyl-ACP reductase-like protein